MKKLFSLLLACIFLLNFAACGSKEEPEALVSDDGRKKITFASLTLPPEIEIAISEFNGRNTEYVIDHKDYRQYNTDDDFHAGETKLLTEIVSGKIPDIMDVGSMRLDDFISKGLLADLNTFLDVDPDINRDSLLKGFYNALSDGDKLYKIAPSFVLTSLYGMESKIGDRESWTIDELKAFLDENPEAAIPFINMPPIQILQSFIMYTTDDFINKETGECSFDSPEFVNLLDMIAEVSKKTVDEYREPAEELLNGNGLLANTYIGDVNNYASIDNELSGDTKVIGYPVSHGHGHTASCMVSLSIFENSKNKEGAWEFIKFLLSKEKQDNYIGMEIPILQSSFDKMLEDADKETVTDQQKEEFCSIVNNLDKYSTIDGTLMGIIDEETASLFSGERSADEVAKTIQSKVSIYLSEQR